MVFLSILGTERGTRHHLGSEVRVELERTHGAHEHRTAGLEAGGSALDVEELLSSHIRTEARLRKHVAVLAHLG